jgi:hypothetical protein
MHSPKSLPITTPRVARLLTCTVLAVLAGCSVRTYEERLNKTNELFQYMNTLNENLESSTWVDPYGFGIQMRVPKPFVLMPPPPAPTEEEPAPVDTRQPHFLPGVPELPGLIGAWTAPLETTGERPLPALLYVMGNHQRFLDKLAGEGGGPEPSEFLNDLESMLQTAVLGTNEPLPVANSGSQDNVKYQERIPRSPRVEGFPVPKDFTAISFLPPPERIESLGGVPIRLQLFEYAPSGSAVQLAILMIYPVSARDDPVVRLRYALETLEMSEQPPQPQHTGDEGSGESPF